jgi:hypothetical protein
MPVIGFDRIFQDRIVLRQRSLHRFGILLPKLG